MTKDELIHKLAEIYNGTPWHGAPLVDLLKAIPSEHFALPVTPGEKTISHILEHMLVWRQYAIDKTNGHSDCEIELGSERDWPIPEPTGDRKEYYLDRLATSQRELIQQLESKEEHWFEELTPGKSYKNNYLIQGIPEHDLYHSGQIGIFNALLKSQNSSS